ncbi:MAG: sensor histidine kinase [Anaerovoracaceae bacterium]
MNKLKRVRRVPRTLTFFLALVVFVIILADMVIVGGIIYLLFTHGIITELTRPTLAQPLLLTGFISIAIAVTITGIFSRIPLNPIRKIIAAINRLGQGDFSVRLDLHITDEFAELSKSFNLAAEELGSIETLRSDFANNFSHEFKTPIISLRGFAKILKNKDLTEEERNEYLDIIINESDRLASLAKNVLTLSRIENFSIMPEGEVFNLTEHIRQATLLSEPKWTKKNLNLLADLDEEVFFKGNPELLSHIWINLIDNAIKFTPEGGTVKIKLHQDNDSVIFTVLDTGPGIDDETLKHMFDRFYQGDKSHTTEGNGIGLALVSKIVKLCDGRIEVQSELGIGSSFIITLPKKDLDDNNIQDKQI